MSPPFMGNRFELKSFGYTFCQSLDVFLHGCLSASSSPNLDDDEFVAYCASLTNLFEKYSSNGILNDRFKLTCIIGRTKDLIVD